ncbi:translation initiation factor IF-3 [Candidatus Wolfebacteria bacterium]|nr:MAG: translation initiation factor IF-3 [Candidatus Wolfebacteria bacterium]
MKGIQKTRINNDIRSSELRVIGHNGENIGVISREDAVAKAMELGLDLIEISPEANPPVAKIADFGKFQYELKKRAQEMKRKSHSTEVKTIQVKIGTGEHDLKLKAKRASGWLKEGHRIKFDLFLPGRTKYMEKDFLRERMDRMMNLVTEEFKIADGPKKSPKGMTVILEKA